jgi:phosphoketolase
MMEFGAHRRPAHGRQSPRQRRPLLHDLRMPDFRDYGVQVTHPASVKAQDMTVLGKFVRDVFKDNQNPATSASSGRTRP